MINVVSIVACVLTMTSSYLVAKGQLKPVYVIGILNGSLYTGLNVAIAMNSDQLTGVIFLAIPSAWGVAMAIKGLLRLRGQDSLSKSMSFN